MTMPAQNLPSSINEITRALLTEMKYSLDEETGVINVANISDVHMGHGRVPTAKIVEWLDKIFNDDALLFLTVIVISGDLFDRRLPHDSDDARLVARWAAKFLRRAAKFKVAIRILEGTPSHDNRQSRWLLEYNEMMRVNADIRYYDEITIDELIPGGPSTLYIPDEVHHDANQTWLDVQEYMRRTGYKTVDFAVMHGMFTFQEPIRSVASHLEERYESIVNHRIMIGHHHTHARSGKIVVPGSVERLRYNEEEDKGHYQFSFSKERGVFDQFLVVNDQATIFTTFDVEGWSFEKVCKLVKKHEHLPNGSNLRFKLSRKDESYVSLSKIKSMFPHFNFATKAVESDAQEKEVVELIDRPVMTSIRPDTIRTLLEPKLKGIDPEVMAAVDRALKESQIKER